MKSCHLEAALSFFYVKGNFKIALTYLQFLYNFYIVFIFLLLQKFRYVHFCTYIFKSPCMNIGWSSSKCCRCTEWIGSFKSCLSDGGENTLPLQISSFFGFSVCIWWLVMLWHKFLNFLSIIYSDFDLIEGRGSHPILHQCRIMVNKQWKQF